MHNLDKQKTAQIRIPLPASRQTKMKTIFLTITTLFFLSSCYSGPKQTDNNIPKKSGEITAVTHVDEKAPVLPRPEKGRDQGYVLTAENPKAVDGKDNSWTVNVWLSNYTKDTLFYFSRSCLWHEHYIIQSSMLQVSRPKCEEDSQVVLQLAPNDSRLVSLEIYFESKTKRPEKSFKIGFDFVKAKNLLHRLDFDRLNRTSVFLWSNNISLPS